MNGEEKASPGAMILGIFDILFGVIGVIGSLVNIIYAAMQQSAINWFGIPQPVLFILPSLGLVFSGILLVAGIGLVKGRRWGATLGIIWGTINMIYVLTIFILGLVLVLGAEFAASYPESKNPMMVWLIVGTVLGLILPIANLIVGISGTRGKVPVSQSGGWLPPSSSTPPQSFFSPEVDANPTAAAPAPVSVVSIRIIRNGRLQRTQEIVVADQLGNPKRNLVGRESRCQIQISTDMYVSSEHCSLTMDRGGNLVVKDLGSTHGTFILRGQQKISVDETRPVFSGDHIFVGPYTELVVDVVRPAQHFVSITA